MSDVLQAFSANPMWNAFALRAIACAYYGGSDLGECFSTLSRIGAGSANDWYREWNATADRLNAAAIESQRSGHAVSAREAFFRASTYYHVSYVPLFGFPVDPRLTSAFEKEVQAFLNAGALCDPRIESIEIPFEQYPLTGYFIRANTSGARLPTIVHVNGYDSNVQEMYFGNAPAATRRGYNCLLIDGPGQGRNLISGQTRLRPDWEVVVKHIIDYALARPEVDSKRIVLAGWSFGGFLAPRAAAFEKRVAALIADPGQWDQRAYLATLPLSPQDIQAFPDVDRRVFDPFEKWLRSSEADPMMRWLILQRGFWVHGVDSVYDLCCAMLEFEVSSVAANIACPTLVTCAEGDRVGIGAEKLYDALTGPKAFVRFTKAEGAADHCEALSRSLYHQRVFDWLDDILS
jgi:pimeloyl-ACP methyl ester carboxylesterase